MLRKILTVKPNLIYAILLAFSVAASVSASDARFEAEVFFNPTKLHAAEDCSPENLNTRRFGKNYLGIEYSAKEKIKICKGIDLFLEHSGKARTKAAPELIERMRALWTTFVEFEVRIVPLPKKMEKDVFIGAAAFPRKYRAEHFQAAVYVPAERADDTFFFYAFWHELQHIHDIKTAWQDYEKVTNYTLEFNGFYIASLLAEIYHLKSFSNSQPVFWKEEWKKFSPERRHDLRSEAIDLYIRSSTVLRDAWNKNRADYNFTRQKRVDAPPVTPSN